MRRRLHKWYMTSWVRDFWGWSFKRKQYVRFNRRPYG